MTRDDVIGFIAQRILRINGHVPWRVHFTSRVVNPERVVRGKNTFPGDSPGCYIQAMMNFVDQLRNEFGITILLIEHTMRVVMSLCPKIIVIDHGETIAVGIPDEIRNNKRVIEAYLGVDEQ